MSATRTGASHQQPRTPLTIIFSVKAIELRLNLIVLVFSDQRIVRAKSCSITVCGRCFGHTKSPAIHNELQPPMRFNGENKL